MVFDGQKAYHQLFYNILFSSNWNYYHGSSQQHDGNETKSFSLNFMLSEKRSMWKIRKSSEITQNIENYEQS